MSSYVPLPVATEPVHGSPAKIGQFFHRWLTGFREFVGFGVVPVGCIIPAVLTSAQISALFDAEGLGKAGRFQGWQICNGNNGSPNLDGKFLRWEATQSGGTGGSDSSAHTHAIDHDHGSFTSGSESSHTHDGTGLYAHVSLTGTKIVEEHSASAPDWTTTRSATATGYARTSPDAATETDGVVVGGTTAAGSAHSHSIDVPSISATSGAASATDNKPAYYELVPLMRVA